MYEPEFWFVFIVNLLVPLLLPPIVYFYETLIDKRALHWWRSQSAYRPHWTANLYSIIQFSLCVFSGRFVARYVLDRPLYSTHSFTVLDLLKSMGAMLAVDIIYYWAHRFLHWNPVYPYFHQKHHQVKYVSVWSSFYAHPMDYLIVYSWFPVLVMWYFPKYHVISELIFVLATIWSFVIVHSPYRELVDGHHAIHHLQPNMNLGTYRWQDRLFGTLILPEQYDPSFSKDKDIKIE